MQSNPRVLRAAYSVQTGTTWAGRDASRLSRVSAVHADVPVLQGRFAMNDPWGDA